MKLRVEKSDNDVSVVKKLIQSEFAKRDARSGRSAFVVNVPYTSVGAGGSTVSINGSSGNGSVPFLPLGAVPFGTSTGWGFDETRLSFYRDPVNTGIWALDVGFDNTAWGNINIRGANARLNFPTQTGASGGVFFGADARLSLESGRLNLAGYFTINPQSGTADILNIQHTNVNRMRLTTGGCLIVSQVVPPNNSVALNVEGAAPGAAGNTLTGEGALVRVRQTAAWTGNQQWAMHVQGVSYFDGIRLAGSHGIHSIHLASGATLGISTAGAQPITFTTNDTAERMRVSNDSHIYIGNGANVAAPTAGTVQATGGLGTDIAGATLRLSGGRSTGSAIGGSLILQTSSPGASGTALNATVDRVVVTDTTTFINTGLRTRLTHVTDANYTALLSDSIIAFTEVTAPRTLNLPAVATAGLGRVYVIKDQTGNAGTHNITVDPAGTELIDGVATRVINTNFGSIHIYCNGVGWFTF